MKRTSLKNGFIGLAAVLFVCLTPQVSQALLIDATVESIGGGLFHWEFTINNDGAVDVLLVTITDAPLFDPEIAPTLTQPLGFTASYDSGLGLVDFISVSEVFGVGQAWSGFAFDSQAGPAANFSGFQALTDNLETITGSVSVHEVPVPEPATLTMLVVGAALVGRRRQA